MAGARRRWIKWGAIVVMVVAVAVLLLFRDRQDPTSRRAVERAEELGIVVFDASELDRYALSGLLVVRPLTPDSPVVLFRKDDGKTVVEFDTSTGKKSGSAMSRWRAATGEVSSEAQFWHDTAGWTRSKDPPRLLRNGASIETAGRHVISAALSTQADKVAVISADGRFRPGRIGMIFGGTWTHATGRHFLDVFRIRDGKRLMEPVALPLRTSKRMGLDHFWTADERFIVCKNLKEKFFVVPTGVKEPYPPVSGEAAAIAGYGLYPLSDWWEHFPLLRLLARYEENGSAALLMHSQAAGSTYRYDPTARTLALVKDAVWEKATGRMECSRFAYPVGAGCENGSDETGYSDDKEVPWEREGATGAFRQRYEMVGRGRVLRPDYVKKKLLRLGTEIPVAGTESVSVSVSPTVKRAVVLSKDEPRGEYFYHELYRLPEGTPIGAPLQLPRAAVDSGRPFHGWEPWVWGWGPEDRYVLYMNSDQRRVCIVHTDLMPQ